MQADPLIQCGEKTVSVHGVKRGVLRLLVLAEGRTVTKSQIAELRETYEETVASKIRYLRKLLNQVGCQDLIETIPSSGYRARLGGWQVDAFEFRHAVTNPPGSSLSGPDVDVDGDVAHDAAQILRRALELWTVNPAFGLPHSTGLELLFDQLHVQAQDQLLFARLRSARVAELREATVELQHRVRTAGSEPTWSLLLRAHASMRNRAQVERVIGEAEVYYQRKLPSNLLAIIESIRRGDTAFLFPVENHETRPAALENVSLPSEIGASPIDLLGTLGITDATHLRLDGSRLTPSQCIHRTRSRLYFSGVLASKWVLEPAVRAELESLLIRLDGSGGDVRFLIINPQGDAYQRLHTLRDGHLSCESIFHLAHLAKRHPSFSVRAFNSLPAFRIVIIDDDVVTFSPYRLAASKYLESDRGWRAPHVVLDPLAPYPLAEAFQLLFAETWNQALPIEEIT
jgi:hypothetical protein